MNKKWWVLIGTGIAAMSIAVDFTIVNASLANIQHDLAAGINQLQWVISGFGLSFCALLVTMGRLGDILGRRRILYTGIIGVGITSLGAGLATTPAFLIIMRFLQGFFGAAIIPCGTAVTAQAFPEKEQGRALGIYGSIVGIGLAFGPVLGSIIDGLLHWRWIFFGNIPVALLSLLICIPTVQESRCTNNTTIDWLGALLLMTALGTLIFTVSEGNTYGWGSLPIMTALIITFLSFSGFYFVEKRVRMPVLPLYLFMNTGFWLALLIYWVAVSLSWPVLFLMPLYLHNIVGFSTEVAGIILASMTLMTVIAPVSAGYFYDKKSKTITIHSVFVLSAASLVLFLLLGTEGPLGLIIIAFVLFGFAWGIGNGIAVPVSLSQLPNVEDAGLVSGALTTAMNIFAVFSLAAANALFRYKENTIFAAAVSKFAVPLGDKQLAIMLAEPEKAQHNLSILPHAIKEVILPLYKEAFMSGAGFVYFALLIVTLLFWLIAGLIIKKKQQARMAATSI